MVPSVKYFKYSKKLFIMYVIVKFGSFKYTEMKYDQINLFFFCHNQKNSCKHIFQYVGFYNYLSIRNPISKNWSGSKYFLEGIKDFIVWRVKVPKNVFLNQLD